MNEVNHNYQRCERPIRVIKAKDRPEKTPDDYQTEHEKAMLRLLVKKHPDLARELTVDDIF